MDDSLKRNGGNYNGEYFGFGVIIVLGVTMFLSPTYQVHDIEFAQIESQVLEGLKQGNNSLKKMQEVMSLEEVEKIMDETADAVEYQRQISDLLGGSLSDEDEADVSCLIIKFS